MKKSGTAQSVRVKKGTYQRVSHEFGPVFDENSRILILGSFPSVKSREQSFYYGHPQNRFWKILAELTGEPLPDSIAEKRNLLLKHGIALWDVIESCEIIGSSDSSIRDVTPTDLSVILSECSIERIFANGGTAKRLFDRYQKKTTGMEAVYLPSTSPANAAWSLMRLMEKWQCITDEIR